MRKLLLASAATLGAASWLGAADAQTVAPMPMAGTQGQMMTAPAPSPPAGANNNNNTTAAAGPGAVMNPTPGSVVIHINGRVTVDAWTAFTSVDTGSPAGGNAGFKVSPNSISTYARLYTGVDGMATNGLRYGGAIEIRENFPPAPGTNASVAGTFSSSGSTNASAYTSGETLFVRRAFIYAAGDQWGIFRAGQADGLISLFDNGVTTFQFDPGGNLNGGDLQGDTLGATAIPFAFSAVAGNEYDNTKFVYLSPQIAGFDFGLQYAPNGANGFSVCSAAAANCVNLSSSFVPVDGAKTVNQTAMGVRYQGKFGDVGLLAYGVWEHAGHGHYNGPFIPTISAGAYGGAATRGSGGTGRFDDVNLGSVGVALTFAGFTVGGNYIGGAVNGQLAARPTGGAGTNAWTAGIKYTAGPFTVGLVGEVIDSQGAVQLAGITQRHEYAINPGFSYTIAPGMIGFGEYVYQFRKQNGFNFVTGAGGSPAYNQVQAQGFMLGTTVYW